MSALDPSWRRETIPAALRRLRAWLPGSLLVLCCAYGLKRHYSVAEPQDLRWMLLPVTEAVRVVTGLEFEYERGTGYLSREGGVAIAKECAGVNFMIAALCMLGLAGVVRSRSVTEAFWSVARAAAIAYCATIVVNAVRIVAALHLYGADIYGGRLTPEGMHRVVGILVYFGGLMVLYAVDSRRRVRGGRFPGPVWAWPLICYLSVTLLVPVLNGMALGRTAPLGTHAMVVVGVASVVLGLARLGRALSRRVARVCIPAIGPRFGCLSGTDYPASVSSTALTEAAGHRQGSRAGRRLSFGAKSSVL